MAPRPVAGGFAALRALPAAAYLARRAEGQSLRQIARGVGASLAVVHSQVKAAENDPEPQ